ncbi:FAD/NAD(P)-binding protein [Actinomadura barringtoniae]|uniref:FAD/NAD(P)-binding protein n=1 Tax=Actinomadura barringtoniae TaxID=1427535 RepID=A0A939T3J8_9ACTN|nr:FAD/NAD(P)-binding protein [Actinomadura barringtoniae]MBO2448208.1 FAD/NAD(P)-binding protein [Actinomadura barringtoniae]
MIAIAGGGASAALIAAQLPPDRKVLLIDKDGRHGLGQAYSTTDPHHLLNACVSKMSALEQDPDHLLRWVQDQGLGVAATDYIPRMEYGRYLRDVLAGTGAEEVTAEVTSVTPDGRGGWRLGLANGTGGAVSASGHEREIHADAVVLATGNRAPGNLPGAHGPRHIADPWAPGALDGVGDGSPVMVVGTGLTMIDLAVTLTKAHPDTVVHAVSRHGLLPRRHRCPGVPLAELELPDQLTLAGLMRAVRKTIEANDGEWRGVVDALRPHVPGIWEAFSLKDKERFLRHVGRLWEVHRHRIPPATAERIDRLQASGRLRITRGRVQNVETNDDDRLTVRLDDGKALQSGWLINGTGPSHSPDPFYARLIAAGIARPGPLGLGIDADLDGAVLDERGEPHRTLFTLGPTLRGRRYETTAIPEIRAQAAVVAKRLDESALSGR